MVIKLWKAHLIHFSCPSVLGFPGTDSVKVPIGVAVSFLVVRNTIMQNLILQGNIYVELLKSCFIVGYCAIALPLSVKAFLVLGLNNMLDSLSTACLPVSWHGEFLEMRPTFIGLIYILNEGLAACMVGCPRSTNESNL